MRCTFSSVGPCIFCVLFFHPPGPGFFVRSRHVHICAAHCIFSFIGPCIFVCFFLTRRTPVFCAISPCTHLRRALHFFVRRTVRYCHFSPCPRQGCIFACFFVRPRDRGNTYMCDKNFSTGVKWDILYEKMSGSNSAARIFMSF